MKTFIKILFGFGLLFLWQTPVSARENVTDWYIKDFQVEVNVNKDSSLDVTEKILADCGTAADKHGIFRIFPKKYKTKDGNFVLPLELISITDKDGNALKYSSTSDKGTITYKIGDADVSVQGENFYEIKYRVNNTIRNGNEDFDELYWNILGNYWDLEIDKFTAQINFPPEINKNNTENYYYAGVLGSKESDLIKSEWISNNSLRIENTRTILEKEGITISVAFPKNIINPYQLTFKDRVGCSVGDIVLFLMLSLGAFIICFRAWKKNGRDPRLNKTIIPEFEIPENLTPIEMGGVLNRGTFNDKALTATIIRLGVLGYLKIEQEKSDFKLIRTNKLIGDDLYELEKNVLNKIFESKNEVNMKDFKKASYNITLIPELCSKLFADLNGRGIIDKSGKKQQLAMFVVGTIVFILVFLLSREPRIISTSLLTASIIIFFFAFMMDRLTPKGAELKWRIKGFKLYMNTAEKYRSRFQEQEGMLDKLLPYAILFGITKVWLKKMKDIYGDKYLETHSSIFMAGGLSAMNFDSFIDTVNQISNDISASSSGASGGGSSGGGGGGGGGGGW